jgi:S1-C subfamily serine protease
VNCPKLSAQALVDFRTARPDVEIARRGKALLGIAGETVPEGCRVVSVVPGLAARGAGLQSGDIITELDGNPVKGYESLTELLLTRQPGDKVRLVIKGTRLSSLAGGKPLGDGQHEIIEVTLSSWQ